MKLRKRKKLYVQTILIFLILRRPSNYFPSPIYCYWPSNYPQFKIITFSRRSNFFRSLLFLLRFHFIIALFFRDHFVICSVVSLIFYSIWHSIVQSLFSIANNQICGKPGNRTFLFCWTKIEFRIHSKNPENAYQRSWFCILCFSFGCVWILWWIDFYSKCTKGDEKLFDRQQMWYARTTSMCILYL